MPTSPKANPRPTGCLGRTPSLGAGSDSHLVLLERSLCRLVTLNETYNLGYGHQRGRDPLEPRPDLASLGTFTSCPRGRPCPCASACRATSRLGQPCPARLWSVSVAPFPPWRTPSSAAPGPRPSCPRRRSWRRRLPWPFP